MNRAVAEIVAGHQPVVSNLFLNAQVPLIYVGGVHFRSIAVVSRLQRKSGILADELWERIRQTDAGVWIVKTRGENIKEIAEWRIGSLRTVGPEVSVVEKEPACCANCEPAVSLWVQRQSQAWSEMPPRVLMVFVGSSVSAPPTGSA